MKWNSEDTLNLIVFISKTMFAVFLTYFLTSFIIMVISKLFLFANGADVLQAENMESILIEYTAQSIRTFIQYGVPFLTVLFIGKTIIDKVAIEQQIDNKEPKELTNKRTKWTT